MAFDLFVDSSGLFALLSSDDPTHAKAKRILADLARTGGRAVTTDYVLDETATLLKARGKQHLALTLFDVVKFTSVLSVVPVWPEYYEAGLFYFVRHHDKPYSFTDCTSFVAMKNLRIHNALAKDHDFVMAGFNAMLR